MLASGLKFLLHLPLGYMGARSVHVFDVIRKHHELQPPNFDHKIFAGAAVIGVLGILTFIWNFLTWLPSFSTDAPCLHFILGAIDLGLAGGLIVGLWLQSSYVPKTNPACREAYTWQDRPYNQSYYAVLGRFDIQTNENGAKYQWNAHGQCKNAIAVWWVTVVICAFYIIGGASGLYRAFTTSAEQRYGHNYRYGRNRRSRLDVVKQPFKSLGAGLATVYRSTKSGLSVFFRSIGFAPTKVQNRLARRKADQRRLEIERVAGTELVDQSPAHNSPSPSIFKERIYQENRRSNDEEGGSAPRYDPHFGHDDAGLENPPAYQQVLLDDVRRV